MEKDEYFCETCDYVTDNKYSYKTHMSSKRHEMNINRSKLQITRNQCEICKKEYPYQSSLWKHKKKCKKNEENEENETSVSLLNEEKVSELIKSNMENQFVNLIEKILSNTNSSINTSNSNNTVASNNNNKTFNMNFFLNEHCKNAIDIGEFIQKLDYSKENMLENRSMNYYERISNQFKEGFENCKVENRPIHCSDSKRNKMYIKDNGEWISGKDSEKRMKEIVFDMGRANMDTFRNWVIDNPSCLSLDTPCYELYMCILRNILGPTSDKEEEKFVNKVISSLAEETMIDKEKYAM